MTSDPPVSQSAPARTLGILWAVYGIVRLCMAIWLIGFSTTAVLMFGALLARVPDPFSLMGAFHLIYWLIVIWSAAAGIFGVLAGLALLSLQRSARTLALLAAFFSLGEIPLGTTLGIYTLIVFMPARPTGPHVSSPSAA